MACLSTPIFPNFSKLEVKINAKCLYLVIIIVYETMIFYCFCFCTALFPTIGIDHLVILELSKPKRKGKKTLKRIDRRS